MISLERIERCKSALNEKTKIGEIQKTEQLANRVFCLKEKLDKLTIRIDKFSKLVNSMNELLAEENRELLLDFIYLGIDPSSYNPQEDDRIYHPKDGYQLWLEHLSIANPSMFQNYYLGKLCEEIENIFNELKAQDISIPLSTRYWDNLMYLKEIINDKSSSGRIFTTQTSPLVVIRNNGNNGIEFVFENNAYANSNFYYEITDVNDVEKKIKIVEELNQRFTEAERRVYKKINEELSRIEEDLDL